MKWEYKVISLKGKTAEHREEILGELGNNKWELVNVAENGAAYLKRPIKSKGISISQVPLVNYMPGGKVG
jgi:hypothetical protein